MYTPGWKGFTKLLVSYHWYQLISSADVQLLELLLEHGSFGHAANYYVKAKLFSEAANSYHCDGQYDQAAATLRLGGHFDNLVAYVRM